MTVLLCFGLIKVGANHYDLFSFLNYSLLENPLQLFLEDEFLCPCHLALGKV